ncbi:ribonuclease H-like domain-containing protein [Tanacetum coccineum]|uniref:Ribonuclease H-like domain-containing protein n=1 Tax=Tanacetum coccineum TaxID=301880 RepID=A0ABQ5IST1_9ASTR
MSEAENHPPASSVTALRIPVIKKGELNRNKPASSSGHTFLNRKLSNVVNARRTMRSSQNIALCKTTDSHLIELHDAQDAKEFMGGYKKQDLEGRQISIRQDSRTIFSMLELYDAKVSCEDANLKFLRSLPSVWHVVATMIRGQPGLDELDFDDLYNNLKVLVPSRQSTADDKLKSSPKASMPETHDDEDLLQIDDDAMEEIDIRWQVAMITARIRKFMRKTGWPIGSCQNGITLTSRRWNALNFGVEYSSSEESNNSSGDETLTGPLYENFKREKAYKAVPPPTGTIIPPRADVAFTGIDELAIRNKVINKQNSESSGTDHESYWVDSDDEEVPLGFSEIKKQTVLKSETSSENKSPRSKDSFGQRSRRRGLGYRDGKGNPEEELKDHAIIDSGCSGSMTGDKDKLSDFKDYKGGYVAFGNDPKGGRIIGKGTIRHHHRLLRMSKLCEGNSNLISYCSKKELLRLGHVNFKNINKLVKSNLVRGLPSKTFKHDHSCLACRKGKQHKASCKKLEEKTVLRRVGVEPLRVAPLDYLWTCFSSKFEQEKRRPRLLKEFENLCFKKISALLIWKITGIALRREEQKAKKIDDLSESCDDLPKDGNFSWIIL